jgi:hypothetical protein
MSGIYDTKYGHAVVITPSDSVLQAYEGIYIGSAGNLTVIMESGALSLHRPADWHPAPDSGEASHGDGHNDRYAGWIEIAHGRPRPRRPDHSTC